MKKVNNINVNSVATHLQENVAVGENLSFVQDIAATNINTINIKKKTLLRSVANAVTLFLCLTLLSKYSAQKIVLLKVIKTN